MNFNVYLDDALVRRLDALAKRTGKPRNALIRHAVASWVERSGTGWPKVVLEWTGDASWAPFEQSRSELAEPRQDPFAAAPPGPSPRRRARGASPP